MEVRGSVTVAHPGEGPIVPPAARKPEKIIVEGLTVDFGSHRILDAISLSVESGEFLALVGPSGCGKSTLLRVVAGLLKPSRGRVSIDEAEVQGPSPSRNLVFQDHALYPWRTVSKNIALGLEILGVPPKESRARVERLLALIGLEAFRNHYPHQLSGGMRQRAALARVLAVDPDVLLLDEPFGSLDAMTRLVLQKELLRLWNHSAKTVILVTHDVDEALYLADRIAIMSHLPARIRAVIEVTDPRPRDRASLMNLKRTVLDLLGVEREVRADQPASPERPYFLSL